MSTFKAMTCHGWAIDGDPEESGKLNAEYHKYGMKFFNDATGEIEKLDGEKAMKGRVLDILKKLRVSNSLNGHTSVTYALFGKGDPTPDHWWIEYGGKLYEKRGQEEKLRIRLATGETRQTPDPKGYSMPKDPIVVSVNSCLTQAQKDYLKGNCGVSFG